MSASIHLHRTRHLSLLVAGALAAQLTFAASAAAQETRPGGALELRITSGAFIPTGAQRAVLGNAQLSAAQVSWRVSPSIALTATGGWVRGRDISAEQSRKLDVFSADLGIETRTREWCEGCGMSFGLFAGAGAGSRTYNYRSIDADATNNMSGYAAVGSEAGIRRVALRIEARNYVSGFRPLLGSGRSEARNDVVVMLALRFNRKAR